MPSIRNIDLRQERRALPRQKAGHWLLEDAARSALFMPRHEKVEAMMHAEGALDIDKCREFVPPFRFLGGNGEHLSTQ